VSLEALPARPELPTGWPEWLDPADSRIKDGRDPLALETITTDRIVPELVPGILALSTRARYFSFHLFLLDEYARRKLAASQSALGNFIRRREFEFGAAVLLCDRCKTSPVGIDRIRPRLQEAKDALERIGQGRLRRLWGQLPVSANRPPSRRYRG
jgi:hypothetical protein